MLSHASPKKPLRQIAERIRDRAVQRGAERFSPSDARSLVGQHYATAEEVRAALAFAVEEGMAWSETNTGRGTHCERYTFRPV